MHATTTSTGPKRPLQPAPPLYRAPPEKPLPWLWQCHLCRTTYHLSVTRRCLEDGHYFCFAPPQIPSPTSTTTSKTSTAKKGRGKRHSSCTSSFDYTAWEAWNAWRRETNMLKSSSDVSMTHDEDALPSSTSPMKVKERKDCWADCDYPSECRHTRLARAKAEKTENLPITLSVTTNGGNRRRRRSALIEEKPNRLDVLSQVAAACEVELCMKETKKKELAMENGSREEDLGFLFPILWEKGSKRGNQGLMRIVEEDEGELGGFQFGFELEMAGSCRVVDCGVMV